VECVYLKACITRLFHAVCYVKPFFIFYISKQHGTDDKVMQALRQIYTGLLLVSYRDLRVPVHVYLTVLPHTVGYCICLLSSCVKQ